MLLAKLSLMEDIDMAELKARGPKDRTEALRIELCDKVNALGIGAQGLGGLTTVLDVKIATTLRIYSQTHQREEAFRLLQRQAEVMPALVDRLQAMMTAIEQQNHVLNERQVANQDAEIKPDDAQLPQPFLHRVDGGPG